MESRGQQMQFLPPIQDSDRQEERNSRVFLKAMVIQASSQTMPDYFRGFRRARIVRENVCFSADPSCHSIRFLTTIWVPAEPTRQSLLRGRMLEMHFYFQGGGDTPCAPREVA